MPFFDTHAHLDNEQLREDLDVRLEQADNGGVSRIISIGTNVVTSRNGVDLARRYEQVLASVGIHPTECHEIQAGDWSTIQSLANDPQVVAIGETGLDRYWPDCPFEIQQVWFARHIELSFELQKPLVIHTRDCEADVVAMLNQHQREGQVLGVMHSFACGWETAARCLELGMYISFSGIVTFKKSDALREIARRVPEDRLLIETDAPYLSPHPVRSQRPNHPALLVHTAQCLADLRGVTLDTLAEITTRNATRLFRLDQLT